MTRAIPVITVLLLSVPALSDTVTVNQTVSCIDNHDGVYGPYDPNGPWFIIREYTLDHDPYHRGTWQDWGWTHNVSALVPANAIGVVSATLHLRTWDIADMVSGDVNYPEKDGIYAIRTVGGTPTMFMREFDEFGNGIKLPATRLGYLANTGWYQFGSTTLNITDAGVLDEIWRNGSLRLFMNIDETSVGHRVTLIYATLTVTYSVMHDATWTYSMPVYRFWSAKLGNHFFTTKESERDKLINQQPPVWTYEGIAYYTYPDNRQDTGGGNPALVPVHRFWSPSLATHFYTTSEAEKDGLMGSCSYADALRQAGEEGPIGIPSTWTYEGVAYYAIPASTPAEQRPAGSLPVYRFYSEILHHHFYTIKESEKDKLLTPAFSNVWAYQGIAWYAFP